MGNCRPEWSLLMGKGKAPPPAADDDEEDHNVLQKKLYYARLELEKVRALSAHADAKICRMTAVARRMVKERDEAFMKTKALLAEMQARRNAQMMTTTLASRSPAAAFSCYGNRVPSGLMMVQDQCYARAAGVSYCFMSSSSHTDSFDPDMSGKKKIRLSRIKEDATEGAAVSATASKSSGSELSLVADQMIRLSRVKEEVVEAPIYDDNDAETSAEETVVDSDLTEDDEKEECCSGVGGSLEDVVSSAGKKQGDDAP